MIILGLIAGALTTCCWLPQLFKSWRTRSTADFSWLYLAVFGTGIALWMAYGLQKRDVAIVVTNTLTLTLTLGVVGLKVWLDILKPRARLRAETTARRSPRPSPLPPTPQRARRLARGRPS
ncbi:SemiSWEET family sugar transporter [Streptomyces hygroscopicus]|uniref:SemiSWEET family sugar transporter n=1 Tax=Streptomyces hygroscopicus TaxID=1912 RepID=UPI00223FCEAD|nr:SemiSWEET family transporter [Streptomyces hygroscopicus]